MRFEQNPVGNPRGKRFEQIEPFGRQFKGNRLGHLVIGQNAIHIVVQGRGDGAHLDHHIEADALRGAALGLEGADLHLDHMITQRDPVERAVLIASVGGAGTGGGMLEGEADILAHGVSFAAVVRPV